MPEIASSTSELVSSVSNYVWPVLVAVILWRLFPVIRGVLESRSYTLNVAGFSISVQAASDNLHEQIADLQRQVGALRNAAAPPPFADPHIRSRSIGIEGASARQTTRAQSPPPPGGRILWVDDKPENNAYEMQTLITDGLSVTIARTTADGLRQFGEGGYFAVITDLGRTEGGTFKPDAGKELIEALRKDDPSIPIYVFTTGREARRRGTELQSAGATGVTGSSVRLLSSLGLVGPVGAEGQAPDPLEPDFL